VGTQLENEENSLGEVDFGQSLWGDAFGETVASSDFINRRISFLSKGQNIQMEISNEIADQNFTISQFSLEAYVQPRRQFSSGNIITI